MNSTSAQDQRSGDPSPAIGAGEPRVALVHDWLTGMRGGEKVLEEMALMFPGAPIFTLFHFEGSASPLLESHQIHTSFVDRLPRLEQSYRHYLPLFPRAIESFDLSDFDLVLSTSHCVAKGVRTRPGTPHLCYCHTPMRYVWDQQRTYFPPSRSPLALVRDRLLARLRRWDRDTSVRPTRFLANSSFVASRIRRFYDRDSVVLHPPVDVEFFTPDPAQTEVEAERAHLLCVAALNAYKKVDLAIEASRQLDLPLVIVGGGPDEASLRTLAQGAPVTFAGRVTDEELRALYRRAIAFVQPGIEDFGIAAAEALGCGTPVVAADEGGVVDIVRTQDDGVLYSAHGGLAALVAAIEEVRAARRDPVQLSRNVQRFSRDSFATGLAQQIESLRS